MIHAAHALSCREISSSHRLMTLGVVALGLLNLFFGEIVPEGGGLGWDGVTYANLTRNLGSIVSEGNLNSYYAHRVLPSAIVRGMLLVAGASFSDLNIIRGFQFYNLALLVGACWIWRRLADDLGISLGGRWLGFSGLFLSFQCSKQAFYYPVLTDVTAFVIGLLLLLWYVERRPVALFLTTITGAFAWQVVSLCGAMLLVLPRPEFRSDVLTPEAPTCHIDPVKLSRLTRLGWTGLLVFSVLGFAAIRAFASAPATYLTASVGESVLYRPKTLERFLTGLPSLAGATIALAMLAGSRTYACSVLANLRKTGPLLVLLAMAAVLAPWAVMREIANPSLHNPSGVQAVVRGVLVPRVTGKFLLPLVTLASFWGPLVVVLLLRWRAFCFEARRVGPGVVAVVGFSIPLGLFGEPRFVTVAWPFFVMGGVLALDRMRLGTPFKYAFATLVVLYSQFWLQMNLSPWLGSDTENILEFPKQLYFMHYGLWMNWSTYLIQLVAVGLSALWLRKTIADMGSPGHSLS